MKLREKAKSRIKNSVRLNLWAKQILDPSSAIEVPDDKRPRKTFLAKLPGYEKIRSLVFSMAAKSAVFKKVAERLSSLSSYHFAVSTYKPNIAAGRAFPDHIQHQNSPTLIVDTSELKPSLIEDALDFIYTAQLRTAAFKPVIITTTPENLQLYKYGWSIESIIKEKAWNSISADLSWHDYRSSVANSIMKDYGANQIMTCGVDGISAHSLKTLCSTLAIPYDVITTSSRPRLILNK